MATTVTFLDGNDKEELETKITNNSSDITKLKNDINTLSNIKADGIVCTTESKLINVKDSSNLTFNEFNVYGESSQTATPSPDYPQEIVNKTINEVVVSGKNLVDFKKVHEINSNQNPFVMLENGYVIDRTPDASKRISNMSCKLKKGQKYAFSFNQNVIRGAKEEAGVYLPKLEQYIVINAPFVPKEDTDEIGIYLHHKMNVECAIEITNIQLELGTKSTPYEPYKEQKVTLSQPITLRGLKSEQGNVTIDGQKYISDVITEKNGVYGVERFVDETVLKTVKEVSKPSWTECVNCSSWNCLLDKIHAKDGASVISKMNILPNVYDNRDNEHFFVTDRIEKNVTLFILDSRLKSVDAKGANEWLLQNKPNIIYPLETPTFEPLPIADQQALKQLHTFYPNTIITNNDNAYMKLNYVADTKAYIDNKFITLSQGILK